MNEKEIAELQAAVERAHRCPPTFRAVERVRELVGGQPLQFNVAVFDILGHPRALVCYAWFTPGRPGQPRIVTMLREGPIHSSADAVRLSLDETEQ